MSVADDFDAAAFAEAIRPKAEPDFGFSPYRVQQAAPPPPEPPGDVVAGVKTALGQNVPLAMGTVAAVGGALEQFFGKGGLSTGLKNWALEGYTSGMQKLEQYQQPNHDVTVAWEKVKQGDLGAMVDFVQYAFGYGMAQMGEAAALALVGSLIGAATGGPVGAAAGAAGGLAAKGTMKSFASRWVADAVGKMTVESGGKLTVKEAAKKLAGRWGENTAMAAYSQIQELGTTYAEAEAEAKARGYELTGEEVAKAWGAGITAGLTEFGANRFALDAVLGRNKRLAAAFKGMSLGGKMLTGGAVTGGVEIGTELTQTGLERFGAGKPLTGEEANREYANAAAMALVPGGIIGGVSGALSHQRTPQTPPPSSGPLTEPEIVTELGRARTVDEAIAIAGALTDTGAPMSEAQLLSDRALMVKASEEAQEILRNRDWDALQAAEGAIVGGQTSQAFDARERRVGAVDEAQRAAGQGQMLAAAQEGTVEAELAAAKAAGMESPAGPTSMGLAMDREVGRLSSRLMEGDPARMRTTQLEVLASRAPDPAVRQKALEIVSLRRNADRAAFEAGVEAQRTELAPQEGDQSFPGDMSRQRDAQSPQAPEIAGASDYRAQSSQAPEIAGASDYRAQLGPEHDAPAVARLNEALEQESPGSGKWQIADLSTLPVDDTPHPGSPVGAVARSRESVQLAQGVGDMLGLRVLPVRNLEARPGEFMGGTVLGRDGNRVYLNVDSPDASPVVTVGHEASHKMEEEHPDLARALRTVIGLEGKQTLTAEHPLVTFYRYYQGGESLTDDQIVAELGKPAVLEKMKREISADFFGNRAGEYKTLETIFKAIAGSEDKGLVYKVANYIVKFIDSVLRRMKTQKFEVSDALVAKLVKDLEGAKQATREIMAEYAKRQGLTKMQAEAAMRSALVDQAAASVKPAPRLDKNQIPILSKQRRNVTDAGAFQYTTRKDGSIDVVGNPAAIRELLPPGVLGRPTPDGLHFAANSAHRVVSAMKGDKLTYGREGLVSARHPVRDGKYIGAPEKFNTPAKLPHLRKILRSLAEEGAPGRYWYERSSAAVLRFVGGDVQEARKFVALLAIYSPLAKVDANSTFALRAWAQYKAGQPISVKTRVTDNKAQSALDNVDAFWSGEKTGNFFFNLLSEIDPATKGKHGATIDMWMMRAGQYDTDVPNTSQYRFMEVETNRLAKELGWEPQQVQAAIWVAMKARMENTGVKKRTEVRSTRAGHMRYVQREKNGKLIRVREVLNEPKHRALWLKEAFALNVSAEDTAAAKFDFADGVRRHIGQVSWEARPSTSVDLLPGVHTALYEQQLEFQQAMIKALHDENGVDMLAQMLGLLTDGLVVTPGVWESVVSPSTQVGVAMPPDVGATAGPVDPAIAQLLDVYTSILGLLLKQDGVGWHRPFYASTKKNANAVDIDLGRQITNAETEALYAAVDTAIGKPGWNDALAIISTPVGVRLVNFGAVDNAFLHKELIAAAETALPDFQHRPFASSGNMPGNNWKEFPDGQSYVQRARAAGRSDVLDWATSVLAPRVDAVVKEFANRYGWDQQPASGLAKSAQRSGIGADAGERSGFSRRPQQADAAEVTGIHYGRERTPVLSGSKYGTGIRGAEAQRLANSSDPRIKRRVYFYVAEGDKLPRPETGLGIHTYRQKLSNLYDPATGRIETQDPNLFESAVLDGGYDGYVNHRYGMAVVLDADVPVEYLGQRDALSRDVADLKKSQQRTDTPMFRKWFGDSKVVDKNGDPLVVYHGASAEFDAFEPRGPWGNAFFFTSDRQYADRVAKTKGGPVVGAYLSISNPVVVPARDYAGLASVEEAMAREGHDGIIVLDSDGKPDTVIALRPEQIKSIYNEGTWSPTDPRISKSQQRAPLWFSPLAKAIEGINAKAQPASAWASQIASLKGIKPDEIEWSGIKEWLALQQGKVTKEALLGYLAGNGVQVEETVLGGSYKAAEDDPFAGTPTSFVDREEVIDEATDTRRYYLNVEDTEYQLTGADQSGTWTVVGPDGNPVGGNFTSYFDAEDAAEADFVQNFDAANNARYKVNGPTRFAKWRVPGPAENYRELLLTLPKRPGRYEVRIGDGRWRIWNSELEDWARTPDGKLLTGYGAESDARRAMSVMGGQEANNFRSGHWDQPNVLAHVRVDERTDADGKRVLFVNELQSDWAQKGRKHGFKTADRLIDGHDYDWWSSEADRAVSARPFDRVAVMRAAESRNALAGKPDEVARAPFVEKTDAWVALALKRVILMAVEEGFDRVVLVNGEQAAEMFDLRSHITALNWRIKPSGQYEIHGATIEGGMRNLGVFPEDKLPDVVGKEIADHIVKRATSGRPDPADLALLKQHGIEPFEWSEDDTQMGDAPADAFATPVGVLTPEEFADNGVAVPYPVLAAAERVAAGGSRGKLEGLDLKVGGKGMRGFYDQIVPKVLKDVLKKLGGEGPTTVRIEDRSGENPLSINARTFVETWPTSTQLGFDVTQALREAAAKGMPLFSKQRKVKLQTTPDPAGVYHSITDLIAERTRTLPVDRVKTPQQAALALASVADYAVEHFQGLVTDKAGRPLALVGSFKGGLTSTQIYPGTLVSELFRIKGAADLWLTHNHPSGKAEFSGADRVMLDAIKKLLVDTGVNVRGFFAQTYTKSSRNPGNWVFTADGGMDTFGQVLQSDIDAAEKVTSVPVVERVMAQHNPGLKVSTPKDAVNAVPAVQDALGQETPFVLFLSSQNDVIGAYPLKPGELKLLRKDDRAADLFRASSHVNAGAAVIVDPAGKLAAGEAENVSRALVAIGIPALDYLRSDGSQLVSENERGYWSTSAEMFKSKQRTDTAAFMKWFEGSAVVDENGRPLRVFHGTTNVFEAFDRARANVESAAGGGFYFSNTIDDVANNYALEGPDLTNRIEHLAEQLQNEDEFDGDYDAAKGEARRRLSEGKPNTMPVYLSLQNPLVLGGKDETHFDFSEPYDEASDEYGEATGKLVDFTNALRAVAKVKNYFELDVEKVISDVYEASEGEGLRASKLWSVLKDSEGLEYAADEEGSIVSTEIVREALERAGFDGIIDNTVDERFGSQKKWGQPMRGMGPDTVHYVAFHPTQIKSVFNEGTFDPANPNISKSQPRISIGTLTAAQQATAERVGAIVEPVTWSQRLDTFKKDLGLRLQQGIFDQFAPIAKLDYAAYMASRMSKGSDGTLEASVIYGLPVMRGGVPDVSINDRGFGVTLATLGKDMDRFFWWVAAKRAKELKAAGKENLFSDTDISNFETLNLPDKETPDRVQKFDDALVRLNEFNEAMLKIARDSDLLDDAGYQLFKDQIYVPFYRVMEDGVAGPGFGSGLTGQYMSKKLLGGSEALNQDLLSNVLQNWAHLLSAAAKNRAAVATAEAAIPLGVMEQVPAGTSKAVRIRVAGVEQHFLVHDPHLLAAISAITYTTPGWFKPFSTVKRVLTIGVTANPAFKIRNLIRDSVQSIATGKLDPNVFANVAQGWAASSPKSQTYASMLASGGMIRYGSSMEGARSSATRRLAMKMRDPSTLLDESGWEALQRKMSDLVDAYQELGDRSENVNRNALYEQLVAKGYSHMEAAFMARDLMDFAMGGTWPVVRFLTQSVPFLNARLQGLYKLGKSAKDDPVRVGYTVGAVVLASLVPLLIYGDDDDWKKREDWDRDNYWWFKIGDQAFRIPKPFEIGAIGTMAERTWELMFDKEMTSSRYGRRIAHTITEQFAMNPTPQIVKPLVDLYANKDSFTGREIESMGMEARMPQDRARSSTSTIAMAVGKLGLPNPAHLASARYEPLSPVQVDHMVRAYFGWLGTAIVAGLDYGLRPMTDRGPRPEMRLKDVFIAGGFVESLPAGSSRYVTQMYEQARQADQWWASYRTAIKYGDTERAAEIMALHRADLGKRGQLVGISRGVTQLGEQVRQIEASRSLSPETKRKMIDALEQRRNELARRAPTIQ